MYVHMYIHIYNVIEKRNLIRTAYPCRGKNKCVSDFQDFYPTVILSHPTSCCSWADFSITSFCSFSYSLFSCFCRLMHKLRFPFGLCQICLAPS